MKIPKQYYIWLAVGFVLLGIFEFYKKEEYDWRPTLSTRDKIPYGSAINYQLVSNGKWKDKVTRINQTFFEYSDTDSSDYSVVYMANHIGFDASSADKLMAHVSRGNTVLFIGNSMPYSIMDTLLIYTQNDYTEEKGKLLKLENGIAFKDTLNKIKGLSFNEYFSWDDSIKNVTTHGRMNNKPNFISVPFGDGKFMFHMSPLVFTNYYFAYGYNFDYVNSVFAYLPDDKIVWDDFVNNGKRVASSELRFILTSAPMRYAYYILTWVFIVFFALFWRRKQSVIPVINPPVNASIAFLNTLTNLYLSNKNNSTIAQYMVRNLRIKSKRKYLIQWNKTLLHVKQQLMDKSGKTAGEVDLLLKQIGIAEGSANISQEQLIKINKTIENFLIN